MSAKRYPIAAPPRLRDWSQILELTPYGSFGGPESLDLLIQRVQARPRNYVGPSGNVVAALLDAVCDDLIARVRNRRLAYSDAARWI